MDPLNTHSYDGKIKIGELLDEISIEQKRDRCIEIRNSVFQKISKKALYYLDEIISSIGTSKNVDDTNGLVAEDILCRCWPMKENNDFIVELELQLLDMETGFCPQGRTHRLFQVFVAFC